MDERERTGPNRLDLLDTTDVAGELEVSKRWVEKRRASDPEFRALWHDIGSGGLHIWRVERPAFEAWFRSRCSATNAESAAA